MPLPDLPTDWFASIYFTMQVLGCNLFQQFAQPIGPPLCRSHDQITITYRQLDFRSSFNSRFFSKRSRDSQSQAVAPSLDFCLHLRTPFWIYNEYTYPEPDGPCFLSIWARS